MSITHQHSNIRTPADKLIILLFFSKWFLVTVSFLKQKNGVGRKHVLRQHTCQSIRQRASFKYFTTGEVLTDRR